MQTDSALIRLATAGLLALAAVNVALGQQSGYLKVVTTTGRAGVFIDDKYVGPSANFRVTRSYPVSPGDHTVTLRDPRYEVFTTHITVVAGKTFTLRQDLKPLPAPKGPFGLLRTEGPDKFAAVYINGAYMGHLDEFSNSSQGLELPPGQYNLKIEPLTAGAVLEQKIELKANETVVVRVPAK